jgi:hypothetical protein
VCAGSGAGGSCAQPGRLAPNNQSSQQYKNNRLAISTILMSLV